MTVPCSTRKIVKCEACKDTVFHRTEGEKCEDLVIRKGLNYIKSENKIVCKFLFNDKKSSLPSHLNLNLKIDSVNQQVSELLRREFLVDEGSIEEIDPVGTYLPMSLALKSNSPSIPVRICFQLFSNFQLFKKNSTFFKFSIF